MNKKKQAEITRAASVLHAGGLVAMPTETVYGLAADAANDRAVAAIFEAKGRPRFNPLIVHMAAVEAALAHVHFSPLAHRLAEAFWPGPLTLVLPRRKDSALSLLVSAGLETVAVRMPAHPMARALLQETGLALAAPSANPSGAVSPTTADHVREGLGDRVDYILDGGACAVGVESSIVKVDGDTVDERATLLRAGGVAREALEEIAGARLLSPAAHQNPLAPGMMASHYAPSVRLRLNAPGPRAGEAWLGFGADQSGAHTKISKSADARGGLSLNLSESGETAEAAANLFAHLRRLDDLCRVHGVEAIAVAPIPMDGLGEAINDRLARAATPKNP